MAKLWNSTLNAGKGFKARQKPLARRAKLRVEGHSETSEDKREIQDLVRACVIKRDGGCVLRSIFGYGLPPCNGYAKDGHLVLQADHLITRANSATYDDARLIVCICKGHHGWKKYHKEEYDNLMRTILPPARVSLWDRAQQDSWRPTRKYASDWKLSIAALKHEMASLPDKQKSHPQR